MFDDIALLIIRGLPGSGKSTLARTLRDRDHYEADQYFMRDGVYCFDKTKLGMAHYRCKEMAFASLLEGRKVVVANTFVSLREIEPYVRMATDFGVRFGIVEAVGNYTNIHNVPEHAIIRMKERWEQVPPSWLITNPSLAV